MIRKVTVNYVSGNVYSSASVELSHDMKREKIDKEGKKAGKCLEMVRMYLDTGMKPEGDFSIHIQDDSVKEMYSKGDTSGYFSFQTPDEVCKSNGWNIRK